MFPINLLYRDVPTRQKRRRRCYRRTNDVDTRDEKRWKRWDSDLIFIAFLIQRKSKISNLTCVRPTPDSFLNDKFEKGAQPAMRIGNFDNRLTDVLSVTATKNQKIFWMLFNFSNYFSHPRLPKSCDVRVSWLKKKTTKRRAEKIRNRRAKRYHGWLTVGLWYSGLFWFQSYCCSTSVCMSVLF